MKEPRPTLKKFLKSWINQDKKRMHQETTKTWQATHEVDDFAARDLKSFSIERMTKTGPVADFEVKLNGDLHRCRLVCENAEYKPSESGVWGVNPISFKPIKS